MSAGKWLVLKLGALISGIALIVGTMAVQPACAWWFYQPEVPEGMSRLRRSK